MGRALAVTKGIVAGILERHGGIRAIVTDEPWSLHAHLRSGERLFVIPDLFVRIPVEYDLWAWTVGAAEIHVATSIWPAPLRHWGTWEAEKYFREKIIPLMRGRENRPSTWWQRPSDWQLEKSEAPANACGGCTACCRTLYIPAIAKPSHQLCHFCTNSGCGVYESRPAVCQEFRCLWLRSQQTEAPMVPSLRPDRCHVIFTLGDDPDPTVFECHVDNRYPDAASAPLVREWIDAQQALGGKARLVTFYFGEAA